MLPVALGSIGIFIKSLQTVNERRNHPDSSLLSDEIQTFAKNKLGISDPESFMVVDDLRSLDLSLLWGTSKLGSLCRPVIAIEKGMEKLAPGARKYFIIKQLYIASGHKHMIDVAFKILTLICIRGLIFASNGFWVTVIKIAMASVVSLFIQSKIAEHIEKHAHRFALKELNDTQKNQLKALYIGVNELRIGKLSPLKIPADLYVNSNEEKLNQISKKMQVGFTSNLNLSKQTALDMPFKLRPDKSENSYLKSREDYHLSNLLLNQSLVKLEFIFLSMGSGFLLSRMISLSGLLSFNVLSSLILEPLITRVHFFVTDWLFVRENPQPKELEYEGIWRGCLS